MGPLELNGIISSDWSLVIMLLIGVAFGMILEQAGFSSTRKLVGIFYGYDFVVLKVFFTAGITAMIGLIFMGYFGWIDSSLIYINSNFLKSALIGGVIMGFGFILGGYCPGTSVCAAAVGRIDAMFFIGGSILGIFLFGINYSTFGKLFSGYYFDGVQIHHWLGFDRAWFVLMMSVMAISAFAVGKYFEKNATIGIPPVYEKFRSYKLESLFLVILSVIIFYIPEQKANSFFETKEQKILSEITQGNHYMNPDQVAFNILNPEKNNLQIIDVRSAQDFSEFHLPTSMHIPVSQILDKENLKRISDPKKRNVFISNGGTDAAKAWMLCRRYGIQNIYVMKGGINGFIDYIFNPIEPKEGEFRQDVLSDYRFRIRAAKAFKNEISNEPKKASTISETTPKVIKAGGGC